MPGPRKASDGAMPRRAPERRRLCMERSEQNGQHYVCQRDAGHDPGHGPDGGHNWRSVDDLTWLDGRVKLGDVDVTDQLQDAINQERASETEQLPKVAAPEPLPDAQAADYFNGDNAPDPEQLQAEAREIAERRPDVIAGNGYPPRPVSISGAPGSRLSDVSSISSTLTLFGIPVELQDELTWAQIGKHALDSMIEEVIRTRQPADPALVTAALDAVMHLGKARGLA